jgi:hypothetical protein
MAYGIKYFINWKARTGELFTFNILQKDYAGAAMALTATAKPFVLQKQEEDPLSPIQATSAIVEYYNDAATPLKAFYSEDDEAFRGDFQKRDGTLLWSGYLVQDDCEQPLAAAPYAVTLKFTDNLGVLKDITFDAAAGATYTDFVTRSATIVSNVATISAFVTDPKLNANEKVFIDGTAYLITSYFWNAVALSLAITLQSSPGNGVYDVQVRINENFIGKHSLFSYLRIALFTTGLSLPLRIFSNIFELTQDDSTGKEMLSQTRLFSGKYINDSGQWTNIYDIIAEILKANLMQLFQAGGAWVLIRKTELQRFADNAVMGVEYNSDFESPTAITLAPDYGEISETNETALLGGNAISRITRPYKYTKETFNYLQPRELIRNINLQELGDFITSYPDGSNTVKEYEAPFWPNTNLGGGPYPDIFIRVIFDNANVELERFLVVSGGTFGGPHVRSDNFYFNQGDRIKINYDIRTSDSETTSRQLIQEMRVVGASSTYKINWLIAGREDGSWTTNGGAEFDIDATQNSNEWHSAEIDSLSCPIEGYFDMGLGQLDSSGTIHETHYKNITITYIPYINDTTNLTGQQHLQTPDNGAKNKYDETIEIDDSPKNAFQGALFTDAVNAFGKYDTLTTLWNLRFLTKDQRLGKYITNERQGLYSIPRTRVEGSFLFEFSYIDNTKVFTFGGATLAGIYFILGNIQEIDFMQMQATGQFLEIHADGEDIYGASDYSFKYLYATN